MKRLIPLAGAMGIALITGSNAHALDGEALYNTGTNPPCAACHRQGQGDTPETGNTDDWAERAEQGIDALVATAQDGIPDASPPMPPMGPQASEEELRAIIEYMLSQID